MKKMAAFFILFVFLSTTAFAFLYEVKILKKEELKKLSNDEIVSLYTDAQIEKTASETFHGKAGFTPKEYENFKELLGLIIRIRQEMVERDLVPPPINEWLK